MSDEPKIVSEEWKVRYKFRDDMEYYSRFAGKEAEARQIANALTRDRKVFAVQLLRVVTEEVSVKTRRIEG